MRTDPLTTTTQPRPWGLWASLAFYGVFVLVFIIGGGAVLLGLILAKTLLATEPDPSRIAAEVRSSGLLWTGWILAICQCALAYGLVRIRRGQSVRSYLALYTIPWSRTVAWISASILLIFASDSIHLMLGRPLVPSVMVEQYLNTENLPLLWSVAIIAGPLWEEIVFRGFLMTGLAGSRLGSMGAMLLTTFLWAVLHTQYDLDGIISVFVAGLLLGYARIKTGSTLTSIAMHCFGNFIAIIETAVVAQGTAV